MAEHEKRIREALEAGPTEGPWVADDNEGFSPWSIWSRMSPTGHGEAGPKIAQIQLHNDEADAAFIAACNPAAIRALLADLDAVRGALEEVVCSQDAAFPATTIADQDAWATRRTQALAKARAALKGATA